MKIQQIRNATLKITYGNRIYLIDPWLEDKGKGMSAPTILPEMHGIKSPLHDLPISPEEILKDVQTVLVTHIHPDHFTEDYLPKYLHMIFQNQEDANKAMKMGFTELSYFENSVISLGGTTITKVFGIHGNNPEIAEKMGSSSGYVFEHKDEKTLYIAGDTVYCAEVRETIQHYQPAVTIVNCCEATTPLGRLIMNLSDVKSICDEKQDMLVIASHLDNVNHALLTRDDIRLFAKQNRLDQRLLIPLDGDTVVIEKQ